MSKMYKRGFYGGKFLPFHRGHKYCIEVAAAECEDLVVIFFANGEEEQEIMAEKSMQSNELLREDKRIRDIKQECGKYPNVRFTVLDCAEMHKQAIEDGTDTWDAETEYVLREVGEFQAVYSSEPSYDAYFKRAYPFAEHRLIDPPRKTFPISGTAIRGMKEKQAEQWI